MARLWHHQLTLALLAVIALVFAYGTIVVRQDFSYREQVMLNELEAVARDHAAASAAFYQPYLALLTSLTQNDCLSGLRPHACSALFARLNARFPDAVNFAAFDASGAVLASGKPSPASGAPDVTGAEFFVDLIRKRADVHVMNPHQGPISGETATGIAVGLYPDDQAAPAGLLGVSLKYDSLRKAWAAVKLPRHVQVFIFDRNDRLIYTSKKTSSGADEIASTLDSPSESGKELTLENNETYIIQSEKLPYSGWKIATLHPGPYGFRQYIIDTPLLFLLMPATFMTAALGILLSYREFKNLSALENAVADRTQDLAEANRTLARRTEELESFAWVASHDLREPLRTISTHMSLLERRCADILSDEAKSYLNYARDGALRINDLVLGLLEFIGIDKAADPPVLIAPVDSLNAVLKEQRGAWDEIGAAVAVQDLPAEMLIRRSHLSLLFRHLLDNAIKHRRPDAPPHILCAGRVDDDETVIYVEDNGKGIDEPYRDRVFALFQRLDPINVPHGIGIGLTLCRKVVERYGGRIWIETPKAGGARICFTVPAATRLRGRR